MVRKVQFVNHTSAIDQDKAVLLGERRDGLHESKVGFCRDKAVS